MSQDGGTNDDGINEYEGLEELFSDDGTKLQYPRHALRPGVEVSNFPKQTRHLHQDNSYQFRHGKFVYSRKIFIAANETEPYRSAYQESDLYADYDPMVGIRIAAVLGVFLIMMAIHLFLRSRRKKRERRKQKYFLQLAAKQAQEAIFLAVEDTEKCLPRIEIDVFESTAEWIQSLDTEDEPDPQGQKQYLDINIDAPRLTPKSSLKKKDGYSTPSRSHSSKSLPDEAKHVHFDLAGRRRRGKRWASFSGMNGRPSRGARRKTTSMYVRPSRSAYEPLASVPYNNQKEINTSFTSPNLQCYHCMNNANDDLNNATTHNTNSINISNSITPGVHNNSGYEPVRQWEEDIC